MEEHNQIEGTQMTSQTKSGRQSTKDTLEISTDKKSTPEIKNKGKLDQKKNEEQKVILVSRILLRRDMIKDKCCKKKE